ncbi:MAG TPA: UvrD-helicase domain-containing protein [Novimethylophilus sp.]|uniref:UvrD-helicase domain-containing protein n=1 Tax=Novimethylophilus sp. TaxID=2137426 RepID=UPI002F3F95B4
MRDLLLEDAASRERALTLESFIVEAPAGAGKTELLTQRYLKLLSVVGEPEEIVAITFTNKAAAEMRSRVLQSLQDAADGVAVDRPHKQTTREVAAAALARSGTLGWDLLAQPGRLRINTIDALSSVLVRQMPLMSRFGAQPGMSDDASVHYREAARRALAMLEEEGGAGAVTEALRYFDNDTVRLTDQLATMLAKRDQWLQHAGHESVQLEVEAALRHLVRHDIARAAEILPPAWQTKLMPVARFAAANLACGHGIALLLDWETPLAATPEALPLWRSVCELLLTGDGGWRKALDKRQGFPATDEGRSHKQALLDIIAALPDPQPLARIRDLPAPRHGDEEWRIIGSLARVLQLAAMHLWTVFQEAGEVDFVEVSYRALQALEDDTGPTDLALRLDYRIRHLLVDEFQDTSPAQVELLRRLTQGWEEGDGRTLFCVGDPMQSIYRFRKADVGLFLQVAEFGVGHLRLQPLHLTRNNRSCPAVVEWVNRAFERVFPPKDSVTRGAIRYRPFAATRERAPGEGVTVHPLVLEKNSRGGEAAMLEACFVADLIERERTEHPGRSIAVLVRARAHLDALVAEIRRHRPHLRFQAVEIEALSGRQTVQDVLALTRALHHRADRVHWLAVLRAPWCGLRLSDLHALAADDHVATIWQLMQDEQRLARLSDDGRQRLLHVRSVIGEAFAHRGRQTTRRWIEAAWLKLAGPYCLWDSGDVRDVQAFLDLIDNLDAAGRFDFAQLEAAMEHLYAAPDVQADGTLQFMTIHKSKGLEFDTVILPGLHRIPKKTDESLLLWEEVSIAEAGPQLIAAPMVPGHRRGAFPSAYDYLQSLERERGANEAARVLYVAATRTERRLHLVGAVCLDARGEIKPPANTFLALLWDTVGGEYLHTPPRRMPEAAAADEADFIPKLIRLHRPAVPALLTGAAEPAPAWDSGDAEAAPPERGNLEADCGTLAHLYMEMIVGEGVANWSAQRVGELHPAMQRWLMRQGHAEDQASRSARRVAAVLCATLGSESGRWVLQSRGNAASELALATADNGRIATHIVDRTFIENGERWVIDYKSARLGDEVPPDSLSRQAERYRPQLERYAGLFVGEGLPVRKGVFFMAHGQLVELK